MSIHRKLEFWVASTALLCSPKSVVWIDGSAEERRRLIRHAKAAGELSRRNPIPLSGCLYHRVAPDDAARLTIANYICTSRREDAGPTNHWMAPQEAYAEGRRRFAGAMKGRTMYVVPFCLGPLDSPFHRFGVQLTDSLYVVLMTAILSRVGRSVLDELGNDDEFAKCLHSNGDLDPQQRILFHFPEDNTVWSIGSEYVGNAVLCKKSVGLRLASYQGRQERWLAEHMAILGVECPDGRTEYIAAAFPTGCGKTSLSMLIPPDVFAAKGYRIRMLGNDIAWLRIGSDGRLWAMSPEAGFVAGVTASTLRNNPQLVESTTEDSMYSEVAGASPSAASAHLASPLRACPSCSPLTEHPCGVPISAILFGSRRANLAPLVCQALDWNQGVLMGAMVSVERVDGNGQHRIERDPMAMLPFCSYHLGDYLAHWLDMGSQMSQPPKVFQVNWFCRDAKDELLWPGFRENFRVIEWILRRCRGEGEAVLTPLGYTPLDTSLDLTDLSLQPAALQTLLKVDPDAWLAEVRQLTIYLKQLSQRIPSILEEQLEELGRRLRIPLQWSRTGQEMHPLACALNDVIDRENSHVHGMLSDLGKRLYFPRGILAQTAEAKQRAHQFNATIGVATENGAPMVLPSVMRYFNDLSPAEALDYAPVNGRPELREQWRSQLLQKNPSLADKNFSNPIITGGLTHGLSLAADLFVDRNDVVLLPDKFWENYSLLFAVRRGAQIGLYPFFTDDGGFNVAALRQVLQTRAGRGKTVLIFNFPNNPTGYSPTNREADQIALALIQAADHGCELVVICDDAYFGLFYGENAARESLFTRLAGCHERILAIKVDGPIKEEFVWGLRIGMLTFSTVAATSHDTLYKAVEQKVAGAIRTSISSCSQLGQSVLIKAMTNGHMAGERSEKQAVLEERARKIREIITAGKYSDVWEPYPFNAGYFMCVRLKDLSAIAFRTYLLEQYGIGVIAIDEQDIRIAFSSVDCQNLESLFDLLATAARELHKARHSRTPATPFEQS